MRGQLAPERVFLHIGLPKTGTTYLQQVLWGNRDQLAKDAIMMPGFGHREHLWAALDLAQRPRLAKRHLDAPGSWQRLVDQAADQGANALFSHEFFAIASREQAARAVASFPHSQVHLIVTARDSAGLVTAGWQESVKNGATASLEDVIGGARAGGPEFSMQAWDLTDVLDRWAGHVRPEHVHLLPMPARGALRDQHWRNFASVLGIDPTPYSAPQAGANPSLGIVQVELLRRVNEHIPNYSALDRGRWLRGYLAEGMLATQSRQRGGLPAAHRSRFDRLDEIAIAMIEARGFDVVGDVSLLSAEPDTGQRVPDSVTPDELVDAAAKLVADILEDVRAGSQSVPRLQGRTRWTKSQ